MKFIDAKKREWNVQLNFRTMCQIEDETGWQILEKPFEAPAGIREWGKIAYVTLRDQVEKRGIDADDFAEGFCGEQFQQFIDAFIREMAVFFKAPRPDMAIILEEGLRIQKGLIDLNAENVQKACEEISSRLPELLASNLGDLPSGN